MNVFRLVLFFILTPLFIASVWWIIWAVIDAFRRVDLDEEFPTCACGLRIVRNTDAHYNQGVMHSQALCQPIREWIGE